MNRLVTFGNYIAQGPQFLVTRDKELEERFGPVLGLNSFIPVQEPFQSFTLFVPASDVAHGDPVMRKLIWHKKSDLMRFKDESAWPNIAIQHFVFERKKLALFDEPILNLERALSSISSKHALFDSDLFYSPSNEGDTTPDMSLAKPSVLCRVWCSIGPVSFDIGFTSTSSDELSAAWQSLAAVFRSLGDSGRESKDFNEEYEYDLEAYRQFVNAL